MHAKKKSSKYKRVKVGHSGKYGKLSDMNLSSARKITLLSKEHYSYSTKRHSESKVKFPEFFRPHTAGKNIKTQPSFQLKAYKNIPKIGKN